MAETFKKPFKPEMTKDVVYTEFTLPSFKQRFSEISEKMILEQEQFTTSTDKKDGHKRKSCDSEKHWGRSLN
jgi:hypothetical protein